MAETYSGGPGKLRGRFFKDDVTGTDMIEIKIIGDPCDLIKKVDPSHIAKFPREWEFYKAGAVEIDVGGTPIIEVPGVDRNVAMALKLKGVRNAEELAGLDEAAAKGLGMGIYTLSKAAKQLVRLRELEAMQNALAEAPRRGRPPNAPKVDDVAPQI
jgi:hypothetical protein